MFIITNRHCGRNPSNIITATTEAHLTYGTKLRRDSSLSLADTDYPFIWGQTSHRNTKNTLLKWLTMIHPDHHNLTVTNRAETRPFHDMIGDFLQHDDPNTAPVHQAMTSFFRVESFCGIQISFFRRRVLEKSTIFRGFLPDILTQYTNVRTTSPLIVFKLDICLK
jgi:hypothetical protein